MIDELSKQLGFNYKFLSKDWIVMLEKDGKVRFFSGYKYDLNSQALEDGCKDYIFSKIYELIEDNITEIKTIELYKILFSLNFFIPYIDEDYSLKFKPINRKMNNSSNNYFEYGFQEFDCLFKVLSNKDLSINKKIKLYWE